MTPGYTVTFDSVQCGAALYSVTWRDRRLFTGTRQQCERFTEVHADKVAKDLRLSSRRTR